MPSPFNNRLLAIIFGVLLVVLLLTRFTGSSSKTSNFRTQLVTLDTAQVTGLTLRPPGEDEAIVFSEADNGWQVQQGEVTARADEAAVENLLVTLQSLKPKRLAARSAEKWITFEVTDSLGTRVEVQANEQTVAELIIGKFSMQAVPPPAMQPGRPPMQQPPPKATSYVRLASEDEVYAVDGFLSSSFNRPFNSWRDREFLTVDAAALRQVTFTYPADSGFVLSYQDSVWLVGGNTADSVSVVRYVNQLRSLSSSDFNDTFSAGGKQPAYTASLEDASGSTVRIEGYAQSDSSFVLRTDARPEVFVNSNRSGLFDRVFVGRAVLLEGE